VISCHPDEDAMVVDGGILFSVWMGDVVEVVKIHDIAMSILERRSTTPVLEYLSSSSRSNWVETTSSQVGRKKLELWKNLGDLPQLYESLSYHPTEQLAVLVVVVVRRWRD